MFSNHIHKIHCCDTQTLISNVKYGPYTSWLHPKNTRLYIWYISVLCTIVPHIFVQMTFRRVTQDKYERFPCFVRFCELGQNWVWACCERRHTPWWHKWASNMLYSSQIVKMTYHITQTDMLYKIMSKEVAKNIVGKRKWHFSTFWKLIVICFRTFMLFWNSPTLTLH